MKEGLSICIPVYNEEEIIFKNVTRLENFLKGNKIKEYEIVIVNNGSKDNTTRELKRLKEKYKDKIKIINIKKKGVGFAFKEFIKNSSYNYILTLDADLSGDLNFIILCKNKIKKNDIIIGSKSVGSQKRPLIRKILSEGFIILTRILLLLDLTDYSISTKCYNKAKIKKFVDKFNDGGSFYVVQLIYYAKKDNLKISQVPIYCVDKRKSKFNILHESLYRLKNLIKFAIKK